MVHAVLAFSLHRAAHYSFRRKGIALFIALTLGCMIAFFDELAQLQISGRVWALADAGINLLGICMGTCLSAVLP